MHPEYLKKRKRALAIGVILLVLGALGTLLPFLQGVVLIVVGLAVLSPFVSFVRALRTRFALAFPAQSARLVRYETRVFNWLRLLPYSRAYVDLPNREGSTLRAIVERSDIQAGTAVVLHSASGTKDTILADTLAERCYELGYSVVRFDAADGVGESGGDFGRFTTSGYLHDLEDIVAWARTQEWFAEPLVLVGHSAGGTVAFQYAAANPLHVGALLLLAPMVSGVRYRDTFAQRDPDAYQHWRTTGFRTVQHPLTGKELRMPYAFVDDALSVDLLSLAATCSVPMTLLHGEHDRTILRDDMTALMDASQSKATLVPLAATRHIPQSPAEFAQLRHALASWNPVPGA